MLFSEGANQKFNAQQREQGKRHAKRKSKQLKIDSNPKKKRKRGVINRKCATGKPATGKNSACHRDMRRAQQLLCSSKNPLEALPAAKSLPSDSNDASNDIVKSEAQLAALAAAAREEARRRRSR